jgi:SAM-dependent methyltransferase
MLRSAPVSQAIFLRGLPPLLNARNDSLRNTREPPSSSEKSRRFSTLSSSDKPMHHLDYSNVRLVRTEYPTIPDYLQDEYWWAYVNTASIRILDHKPLVNIVLWGNFEMLRDAAIDELCRGVSSSSSQIHGKTLQVACVYADLSQKVAERLAPDATLDVIDVVPYQLENLQSKMTLPVHTTCADARSLPFDNNAMDQVLLFLLLHEMPTDVRRATLEEAARVLKPGGKMVILDYHRPDTNRWQAIMKMMYKIYEPFALDMFTQEIQDWLPATVRVVSKELFWGGLYQKVVVEKPQ